MLKSIDVLLGLTVVLLALSMAVTVVTQTLTTIVNSRGRHLRRGLVDLLQQLDPQLTAAFSKQVATGILTHPLVSGSNTLMSVIDRAGTTRWVSVLNRVRRLVGGPRLGNVVHREEFTKLLIGLACDGTPGQLEDSVKGALQSALKNNGIDDPARVLKNIRQLALQLERSQPELASISRQNLAILHAADSDLVAKINNWFDQTMDRTSQRFTASTRAITFVGAFVVAFALQVDTPAIVNRLAADDALREQFVIEARSLYEQRKVATAATTPSPTREEELAQRYTTLFATTGLIALPTSAQWSEGYNRTSIFGMLLTALLLSLGAPFWYNVLGRLLQLRSILATKDDAHRADRQRSETAPGASDAEGPKRGVDAIVLSRGD